MYALAHVNHEDQEVQLIGVGADRDKLMRAAFEIEIELTSQGAEDDDEQETPNWGVADWVPVNNTFTGKVKHWTWAPEWFSQGFYYQVGSVMPLDDGSVI
jgi:hypothetical protein